MGFDLWCRQLGGFKDIPIMEDYELVSRLRKHGRPAIIPQAMRTSGRRWRNVGFLQTTLINQVRPSQPPTHQAQHALWALCISLLAV